jgi:hypothetical protein
MPDYVINDEAKVYLSSEYREMPTLILIHKSDQTKDAIIFFKFRESFHVFKGIRYTEGKSLFYMTSEDRYLKLLCMLWASKDEFPLIAVKIFQDNFECAIPATD